MSTRYPTLRHDFDELGYCLVPQLVDAAVVSRCRDAIERFVTPDTPDDVAHRWGTRRQTLARVFIPELDEIAVLPSVLDVVAQMIDGPFRLSEAPITVVTFPGTVCGSVASNNWIGHLDGVPSEPFEKIAHAKASLWVTFADIEPGGGAMTVIPGSHLHVHQRVATDPAWVAHRTKETMYTKEHGIEGMPWNPIEITCKAGDGFFYYGHSVHSASDNSRTTPRLVSIFNYVNTQTSPANAETLAKGFSEKHLAGMNPAMRAIVGM